MENLSTQMRVQLTGKEENKADLGITSDRKIPMEKTQSFKAEKKKGQSWLQKQLSSKTGRDNDYIDMVHSAAVAAAALSINLQETSEQKSRRVGTSKRAERTMIDKIKQWEDEQKRTVPDKIKKRYEKLKELIDFWEDKKKIKVKRKLMKQQSELEKRKLKSLEKYVDLIAYGAGAKAEESRKKLQSELEQGRKKSLEKFQNKMEYVNIVANRARAKAEEWCRKKGKASTIPTELLEEIIDKYPGVLEAKI